MLFILKAYLLASCLLFSGSGAGSEETEMDQLEMKPGNELTREVVVGHSMKNLLLDHSRGGVIVHVGFEDGMKTAELVLGENFIVQGISVDQEMISKARGKAFDLPADGKLSFREWKGNQLPYTSDLVNVIFWERPLKERDIDEIMRVLTPGGIAFIRDGEIWQKIEKPWPEEIDEWPSYRYDAGNKGASKDKKVGPPRHLQWEAGPRFMRSHEVETGVSSLISANGLVYYILDEGPIGITDARFPPKWSLMCRDGFNGALLWKQPMPEWGWQAWEKERENNPHVWHYTRNSPVDVDRVMAADGDKLYVTLSFGAPVSVIDGRCGRVLSTYEETSGVKEFIVIDGILIARMENPENTLLAIRNSDGKVIWKITEPVILERTLSAAGNRVFYHGRQEMVSVDLTSGKELWRIGTQLRPNCLLAQEDVVIASQSSVTLALSSKTGEKLWEGPGTPHRAYYPELYVLDSIVWIGRPSFNARNIKTGEVIKQLDLHNILKSGHHRRCFTEHSTCNYIITGERGSEFLDLRGDDHTRNDWVRGACVVGGIPANGLYYTPPSQCFCYPAIRMDGFFALSSQISVPVDLSVQENERLEKGPAYGTMIKNNDAFSDEWTMYRHDPQRSGSNTSAVSHDLKRLWSVKLGGDLTQAVVSGQRAFIVQKNAGTVNCIDLKNGKMLWNRTVSGPIDSPPSIYKGFLFFGSHDGFVYALRARDGKLAWRFNAAPEDRQIISYERFESAWPSHGSVLINDGLIYCSAGRSGFLDGGIYVYALDAESGQPVYQNRLSSSNPDMYKSTHGFHEEGFRSDLLTTDGNYLYMGRTALDKKLQIVNTEKITTIGTVRGDTLEYRKMPGMRLVATGGFLDDKFWSRTYWMYSYLWPGFQFAQQAPKSGQMMVFNDKYTYSVKFFTTRNFNSPMFFPGGDGYLLFSDDIDNEPLLYRGEGEPKPIEWEPKMIGGEKFVSKKPWWSIYQDASADKGPGFTRSKPARWTSWENIRIGAMVLAGDDLVVAGTPDVVPEDDPLAALEGRLGAVLKIISAKDGKGLAEYKMESEPVFDGLIAVQNKLLVSNKKGELICMGKP